MSVVMVAIVTISFFLIDCSAGQQCVPPSQYATLQLDDVCRQIVNWTIWVPDGYANNVTYQATQVYNNRVALNLAPKFSPFGCRDYGFAAFCLTSYPPCADLGRDGVYPIRPCLSLCPPDGCGGVPGIGFPTINCTAPAMGGGLSFPNGSYIYTNNRHDRHLPRHVRLDCYDFGTGFPPFGLEYVCPLPLAFNKRNSGPDTPLSKQPCTLKCPDPTYDGMPIESFLWTVRIISSIAIGFAIWETILYTFSGPPIWQSPAWWIAFSYIVTIVGDHVWTWSFPWNVCRDDANYRNLDDSICSYSTFMYGSGSIVSNHWWFGLMLQLTLLLVFNKKAKDMAPLYIFTHIFALGHATVCNAIFFGTGYVNNSGGLSVTCFYASYGSKGELLYEVFWWPFYVTWTVTAVMIPILCYKLFFANRMEGAGSRGQKHYKVLAFVGFYFVALGLSFGGALDAVAKDLPAGYRVWVQCSIFLGTDCHNTIPQNTGINVATTVFIQLLPIILWIVFCTSKQQFENFFNIWRNIFSGQSPFISASTRESSKSRTHSGTTTA